MDLLAPGGGLERAIPYYEDRAEQRAMSAAVARALADQRPLIVEAGTGTGKTLAYLVPALQSGKRVVVSTGTRTLQDQIARHDIPLLRTILARPFAAVVLKGVSNYVCRRKLAELRSAPRELVDWVEHSETGDRAEAEWLPESSPLWPEVTTTPDARIGPRCPYFERCFVTQARRLAERAELILVNHSLYFADRALRSAGARVLPDHDAVIFDEAHQLEDVATEHFGARVSTQSVALLVRDARLAMANLPLFSGSDPIGHVERSSVAMFGQVRSVFVAEPDGRAPLPPGLFDHADRQRAWFELDSALEELARAAESEGEPGPDEEDGVRASLAAVARRARGIRDDLALVAEQRQRTHVYWGEAKPGNTALVASPIEVAELVRRHIVRAGPTPIFTSATLAVAAPTVPGTPAAPAELAYSRTRLGLDEADELIVPSPFDYSRQAILYLPRDLPPPADDAFSAAAAQRMLELLEITGGRAFLLFTSHRALRDAAARLAKVPYPRFVQGDAPRATLVDRFRATPGAILLGTGSFWEGVDVPGDALSLVVIDKLPFAPHTDPLVAARMQTVAEAGGDPFQTLQLPAAALALKQGFGRLIRRRDDRGIVAILDSRIVTKGYGRVFVETLPAGLPRTSAIEQVRRWWSPARSDELHALR